MRIRTKREHVKFGKTKNLRFKTFINYSLGAYLEV